MLTLPTDVSHLTPTSSTSSLQSMESVGQSAVSGESQWQRHVSFFYHAYKLAYYE